MNETEAVEDWPPTEADQLWLVHGTMGAAISWANEDGADRAVLMRVGARRNLSEDEMDATLLLDLDRIIAMIAGLLSVGNTAFGRDTMQRAMAEYLIGGHRG